MEILLASLQRGSHRIELVLLRIGLTRPRLQARAVRLKLLLLRMRPGRHRTELGS